MLLSDRAWQEAFNADPGVLGRPLDVEGTPYTIIGVLPPRFAGLSGGAAFWIPVLTLPATWRASSSPGGA